MEKESENLSVMKDEKQAIRKFIVPILKEQYFVRISVRVDRLHQKLKTEGVLSPEEISVKHPFHPDIDVLFWAKKYSGEPKIYASEVKYFRLRNGNVYPNIYEGLGEAMMLLTFGVNHVSLWHLFDPEIPSETVSRYRDLTQNLVSDAYSPINYHSWLLPEIPKEPNQKLTSDSYAKFLKETIVKSLEQIFFVDSLKSLKSNPLMNRWDTKIMRLIIKRGYRIVNK